MLIILHVLFLLESGGNLSKAEGKECDSDNSKRPVGAGFSVTHISDTMYFHCSPKETITRFCQEVLPNSNKEWYDNTCTELHKLGANRCNQQHTNPSMQGGGTLESIMIDLQVPMALYHIPPFPVRLADGSMFEIKNPSDAVNVCLQNDADRFAKSDCRKLLAAADPMGTVRWGSIDIVARQYEDSPQAHFERRQGFQWQLAGQKQPLLDAHAGYVRRNRLGFADEAVHWLWKLLVDAMPSNDAGFHFLEIGVYKGSVPR